MSEQLKACPFCGDDVQFHKDEECGGCHYIQCGQCRVFFDFATGADPENNCESVDALRAAIVPMWNTRAQDYDTLAQRLQEAESLLGDSRYAIQIAASCQIGAAARCRCNRYVIEQIDAFLADKGGKA